MAELNVNLEHVKASLEMKTTLSKPGAVRLHKYRHLVHAPAQWGEGIRLEDCGASVVDIATEYAVNPDAEALAKKFGTTPEHIEHAIAYAAEVGSQTSN